MGEVPSKAYLDSRDDQLMAAIREGRAQLEARGEADYLALAGALADLLRRQFPGEAALGRITLAVAKSLQSIHMAAEVQGRRLSRTDLVTIGGLAAEQLEREAKAS